MKYNDAQEVIRNHSHLIGKINEKGFVINELIMVPQDEDKRNRYIQSYIQTKDANRSIEPYINEELSVWAIDTKHLMESNVLFYQEIVK